MRLMFAAVVAVVSVVVPYDTGANDLDIDQAAFFESKVRPLLIAKCFECHSADKPKSGLRLDSREAILAGGDSGPAAVVGKPDESLLMDVIGYRNSIQMPPKAKLSDPEIAILTDWVKRGMSWPNSTAGSPVTAHAQGPIEFTDEQKSFWAFQPVKRTEPPSVRNAAWIRSPLDGYILAELESKGLEPARPADRRTLIRRVTVDLIGLLPTPDEVDEFVNDASPDALERVIDRLLASPRYGERWARHWLDVARYADSNGLDENLAYANAYRYRDYVVRSFRHDKPYNQFLMEQIAGDLLIPRDVDDSTAVESSFDPIIATGFLCLGAKMLAEDDPVKMQMDIIDEQVDTIARAVMGLTMGCARCHDHKYDPLTMEDYYGLAGIFKSTQTMDTFTVVARWHERPLATPHEIQRRDELQRLATEQKQRVDKIKGDAAEEFLAIARKHTKDYLLAAAWDMLIDERLKSARPMGNNPETASKPGAILIEAEDYARGNVLKEREAYGKGIGVLVNRGESPNFTEYDVTLERNTTSQLELRYAAANSRPIKIFVNGSLVKSDAASKVTGSWTPESQTWFVEAFVELKAGANLIRLEQPQAFPHIDKLLLVPIDSEQNSIDSLAKSGFNPQRIDRSHIVPSITKQWVKAIELAKTDETSLLAAWNQFMTVNRLSPSPINAAVERILGETQPTSLVDLAERYERLFGEADRSFLALKASDAGRDAKSLDDPVLESARSLLSDPKGPLAAPEDIEQLFAPDVIAELKSGREELTRRESVIPKFSEAMAVADAKPENLRIHLRGSHLTLGREVPHLLPRILTDENSRALPRGSGRLELAQWLTSDDHRLTSRVMVNRVWQWHFGQGLVRSSDNFGRLGERPSHPALLDWLASEFTDRASNGTSPRHWSLKSLHRVMMSSSTYRQSTEFRPAAMLVDPDNRLLWRFHRQRMDVEVLRDSLLALSHQLDETPGGTMLPTPNRNYVTSTANVNPAIYNSSRRAIYLPVVRSALYDVFTAFDFADPSTLAGQRDQTTVAPQALFMMNSPFVLEQSRRLAEQLLGQSDLDSADRIRQLYRLTCSRDPSESEVSRASGYLDRLESAMQKPNSESEVNRELRVWTSFCRAVLSTNEYVYLE